VYAVKGVLYTTRLGKGYARSAVFVNVVRKIATRKNGINASVKWMKQRLYWVTWYMLLKEKSPNSMGICSGICICDRYKKIEGNVAIDWYNWYRE